MAAPGLDEVMAFLTDHGFARAASALRDDVRARTATTEGTIRGDGASGKRCPDIISCHLRSLQPVATNMIPVRDEVQVRSFSDDKEEQSTLHLPKSAVVVNGDAGGKVQTYKQVLMQGRPSKSQQEPRQNQKPCRRYLEVTKKRLNQDGETLLPKTECIDDGKAGQLVQATSVPLDAAPATAVRPTAAICQEPDNDALLGQRCWQAGSPKCSCSRPKRPEVTPHLLAERRARYLSKMKGVCFNCLASDHQVASCQNPTMCWVCRHPGHISAKCPSRQSNNTIYARKGVASSGCCKRHQSKCPTSLASTTSLDPKSVVTPLLEALLPEFERLLEVHLERMMQPLREELSTIKLWLARMATQVDCCGEEREQVLDKPAADIAELFGPFSPVRFSSSSTILDSLAEYASVDPLECKATMVDVAEPSSEIPQELPSQQTVEVSTMACTAHVHEYPQKQQMLIQAGSRVEDIALVEDAPDDDITSHTCMAAGDSCNDSLDQQHFSEAMIEGPDTIDGLRDCSSSSVTTAKRDENHASSIALRVATARCGRISFGKFLLRRSRRPPRSGILEDLGFVKKNGKLDKVKLEAFGDLLEDFLPPDLMLSLMSLKGRALWKAIAIIFDPVC